MPVPKIKRNQYGFVLVAIVLVVSSVAAFADERSRTVSPTHNEVRRLLGQNTSAHSEQTSPAGRRLVDATVQDRKKSDLVLEWIREMATGEQGVLIQDRPVTFPELIFDTKSCDERGVNELTKLFLDKDKTLELRLKAFLLLRMFSIMPEKLQSGCSVDASHFVENCLKLLLEEETPVKLKEQILVHLLDDHESYFKDQTTFSVVENSKWLKKGPTRTFIGKTLGGYYLVNPDSQLLRDTLKKLVLSSNSPPSLRTMASHFLNLVVKNDISKSALKM